MTGLNVAGGVALKGLGVAAATPSIGFAFAGPFAKLLLTAEFFGSGFSRDKPILCSTTAGCVAAAHCEPLTLCFVEPQAFVRLRAFCQPFVGAGLTQVFMRVFIAVAPDVALNIRGHSWNRCESYSRITYDFVTQTLKQHPGQLTVLLEFPLP